MKRTFTQAPIIPDGYTGENFNNWQFDIQKEIDKLKRTNLVSRMLGFKVTKQIK